VTFGVFCQDCRDFSFSGFCSIFGVLMGTDSLHADYDRAQKEALRLLEALGYRVPPISPLDVAAHLGLSVKEAVLPAEYKNVSGFVDILEKQIVVNKEDGINRRVFTIAHEIGHYLLHKDIISADPLRYTVLFRDAALTDRDVMEKEANYFAANLLVPESMLSLYGDMSAGLLAGLFGVSQQVVHYRLSHLEKNIWKSSSSALLKKNKS
jgi:Zn-dependent peptidase ImmA (M78 family)